MDDSHSTVTTLGRGLVLLQILAESGRAMSLAEVARASALHKTTALRLLRTLTATGFAERTDGRFQLGPTAFKLGLTYQRTHRLHLVRPTLCELLDQGCESPSLHVRNSTSTRLCLLRLDAAEGRCDGVATGLVLPLERGAPGHVLAAFQDGASAHEVTTKVSWGEVFPDCVSVAAPIFSRADRLYGALSVSGPRVNFGKVALDRVSQQVLRSAAHLTQKLGGDPNIYQAALAG